MNAVFDTSIDSLADRDKERIMDTRENIYDNNLRRQQQNSEDALNIRKRDFGPAYDERSQKRRAFLRFWRRAQDGREGQRTRKHRSRGRHFLAVSIFWCIALAAATCTAANVWQNWIELHWSQAEVSIGLWQVCSYDQDVCKEYRCYTLSSYDRNGLFKEYTSLIVSNWHKAVQGMMCLALFFLFVSLILSTVNLFFTNKAIDGVTVFSNICAMATLAMATTIFGVTYTRDFKGPEDSAFFWEYGGSFYLTVVALLVSLVAGILSIAQTALYWK